RSGLMGGWRYWQSQIDETDRAVQDAIGVAPRLFRPPMGFKSPPMLVAARRKGLVVVTWSKRAGDGVNRSPQRITAALSRGMAGGDIALLHDGRDPASRRDVQSTVKALPAIIGTVRDQGLRFARLDEVI